MNPFFSFIFFLIFVSCSSSRIDRKIIQANLDAMGNESLLRWDKHRLSTIPSSLANICYKDADGELKFKEEYLQHSSKEFYWIQLGNCYFLSDKWPKAEFYYRLSLEFSKNKIARASALNNLALISFKYQQWGRGGVLLKEAIALNPSSRVPKFNLSQLYIQFAQFDLALDLLGSNIFNGAQDVDLYLSLGTIWLYKGDLKRAESFLTLIPKNYFEREDIAAVLSLLELKKGNLGEAKKVIGSRNRSHVPELTIISQKLDKVITSRIQQE